MINKERGPRDIVNGNRLRLLILGVTKVVTCMYMQCQLGILVTWHVIK